ncbi:MAG: hypothetical protein HY696_11930 [Deltaproteobacteria bacterium]|nr:hypothetical protein [Deltaproteobacteria bacterium]
MPPTPTRAAPTTCQSSLFDCAKARGVLFPDGFTAEELFVHPLQDALFAVGSGKDDSLMAYAFQFLQFQQPTPIQPITCEMNFPAGIRGVVTREGAAPIFYSTHEYFQLDEAQALLKTDEAGVTHCQLSLVKLPLSHTCPGEAQLLSVHGDWDLNADDVSDVVGVGRCDKAALWLDLFLSTPTKQVVAQTFTNVADAVAFSESKTMVQTTLLDASTIQIELLSAVAKALGGSPRGGPRADDATHPAPTARVQCVVKLAAESGVVGTPSCESDVIGPMPEGVAVAIHKAGVGAKSFIMSSDGKLCKSPKSGKADVADAGTFECESKPGQAMTVKAAVGAMVGSKGRGGKLPNHVVFADEAVLHLATLAENADGLTLHTVSGETLVGAAPLDGIGAGARYTINSPHAVTIVNLDKFGGNEVCALFTKRQDEKAAASLLVCHRNRNETPSIQLQTPAVAADTNLITLEAVTNDPTDDTLATTWSFTDANGSDVSQHFEVQGNTATFHVPAEVPTSWNVWDLFLPTAHAEAGSVAWPVTATAVTCDAGGACSQSTAQVSKDLQVTGAVVTSGTSVVTTTGGDAVGGSSSGVNGTNGTGGTELPDGNGGTGLDADGASVTMTGKGAEGGASNGAAATTDESIVAFGYVGTADAPIATLPPNESGEQVPKVVGDPTVGFEGLEGGVPEGSAANQDTGSQPDGVSGDAASGPVGGFDFGGGGCSFIPR